MEALKALYSKPNKWYDKLEEPWRFMVFFIPMGSLLILAHINPLFFIPFVLIAIPRGIWIFKNDA